MSATFIIIENSKGAHSIFEMPSHCQERLMNFVENSLKRANLISKVELFNGSESGTDFSLDALMVATEIMLKTLDEFGAEWEKNPDWKNVEYTVEELQSLYTKLQSSCKKLIGRNSLEFHSRII